MFCPYCGKEMDDNDVYCGFCGAKNETVKSNANPTYKETDSDPNDKNGSYTAANPTLGSQKGSAAPKKKMSAGKIILTVFICCTVVVILLFSLIFVTLNVLWRNNSLERTDNYIENFEDYFDKRYGDYDEDDYYNSLYSSSNFTAGKTEVEKNSYKSEFGGLDFSLPSTFETYSSSDISKLYDTNNISDAEVKNYLTVYDFFSINNISGTQISIDYYNEDYYSDVYSSFENFVEEIKLSIDDYGTYNNATVSFADDSSITLNGNKYTQIAARISEDNTTYYEYSFMREVDGYYMKITVLATDLNNVGEIIDILNGENK